MEITSILKEQSKNVSIKKQLDYIGYKFEKIEGDPTPIDSCIGGVPYLPKGVKMPKGEVLYVQINLDTDKIDLADFPSCGILQFFISKDSVYGDTKGTARYYETINDDYKKDITFKENDRVSAPFKIKLEKVVNSVWGISESGIGGVSDTCQGEQYGIDENGQLTDDVWFGMDTDTEGLEMLGDCGIIVCHGRNPDQLKELKEKGEIKVLYHGDCY